MKKIMIIFFIFLNTFISAEKLKLQLESDHFMFYSTDKDINALNDLKENLEKNFIKITNDLETTYKKKLKVYIYPDVKSYHYAIDKPDAPDWMVGSSGGPDTIKMVSPLNPGTAHSYKSLMKTIVHEFTHAATWNKLGRVGGLPRWLSEGFAYYEADQFTDTSRNKIRKLVSENNIPSIEKLESMDSVEFSNNNGYGFSAAIIEFIIKKYGMKKVVELIINSGRINDVLGISKEEFEKEWIEYLKVL